MANNKQKFYNNYNNKEKLTNEIIQRETDISMPFINNSYSDSESIVLSMEVESFP